MEKGLRRWGQIFDWLTWGSLESLFTLPLSTVNQWTHVDIYMSFADSEWWANGESAGYYEMRGVWKINNKADQPLSLFAVCYLFKKNQNQNQNQKR